jgi:hypothetical protein
LIGINIHREIGFGSINAGHYVSIVKNKYNNKWYVFDDAKDPEELEENEDISDKIVDKFSEFQVNYMDDSAKKNTKNDVVLMIYNNKDKVKVK